MGSITNLGVILSWGMGQFYVINVINVINAKSLIKYEPNITKPCLMKFVLLTGDSY